MSLLFETIRISGGKAHNLELHEARLNRSRRVLFGQNKPLRLAEHIIVPDELPEGITRCRVICDSDIRSVEFTAYKPAQVRSLKTVDAGSLEYDHKYLDRSRFAMLREQQKEDDILMTRHGFVTDVTFANIVFYDGRRWLTPDTPLLEGTMRELLLRGGLISEARVRVEDLGRFSHFRLINAMLGFEAPVLPVSCII
ncbi:MAG: aminotransferase class IV [Bacteroidales bacterium]|jgi:4-amino-4-deoxychorismate lyase|nr:aminotransferase class IV [Bacteroidales bacterium]